MERALHSPYLDWSKTKSNVKNNLASSGLIGIALKDLPFKQAKFEINTHGSYGFAPLITAIGEHYHVDPANIATTIGTTMANFLVLSAVVESGDEILVEYPTYEPILSTASFLGLKIKRFERTRESHFCVELKKLEKAVSRKTRLIVLTNLHNPSSAYTDEQTLQAIGIIAKDVNAHVLVDEVYLGALFEKAPKTSFLLGNEFIVTNSLTKVYGVGGTRCGWIFADADIVKKIWDLTTLMYAIHAHPAEQLSYIAFTVLSQLAARAKNLLSLNMKILNGFLDEHPQLEVFRPEAGTVVFPRLSKGSVEKLTNHLLEKYETAVVPGRFFEMDDHFRIGIGCSTNMLKSGLKRLRLALEELPLL
jgi:hypothetical protein